MANKKETAVPNVSVGADTGQPLNVNNNSITNYPPKNNSKVLEIVSMAELYDSVYPSKPPLIEGLLYPGTYLFVGAPKLGTITAVNLKRRMLTENAASAY